MNKPIRQARMAIPKQISTNHKGVIKVVDFQVINFVDDVPDKDGRTRSRPIIIMYALAEDGIVYEFNGGKWKGFPVTEEV
jgi:hypothetical protein